MTTNTVPLSMRQGVSKPLIRTSNVLEIEVTRVYPIWPRRVFVQWVLRNVPQGVPDYWFNIYKSSGPTGPWVLLAEDLDNEYHYVDESFGAQADNTQQSLFNMHVSLNYKIEVLTPPVPPPITTPPTPIGEPTLITSVIEHLDPWADQRRAGISRKLIRDALISLKAIGTECAILKKKTWGARCPLCVSLSNKSTRTACPTCYGTTITGGFENPHYGYAIISSNATNVSTRIQGQVDVRKRTIIMANVPHMDVDDIVVFTRSGKRFIVTSVLPTTIQDTDVHQELEVSELTPGSIEYEINVEQWREPCWWVTP
jgi:hypothetical protein